MNDMAKVDKDMEELRQKYTQEMEYLDEALVKIPVHIGLRVKLNDIIIRAESNQEEAPDQRGRKESFRSVSCTAYSEIQVNAWCSSGS